MSYGKYGNIIPNRLKKGDKVGIIAPASTTTAEKIEVSSAHLKKRGFVPVLSENLTSQYKNGIFFGSEKTRARHFNEFCGNPEIKAIICVRGGYGSMHILPQIDLKAVKRNRPIFIGYSDITALQTYFFKKAGLVTFHGPMPAPNAGEDESFDLMFEQIMNPRDEFEIINNDKTDFSAINPKAVRGNIVGGNLAVICSLIGTPYEIDLNNKILFIEEVGEKPYALHRMMWHLKLAGKLEYLLGAVIGSLTKCGGDGGESEAESGHIKAGSAALDAVLDLLLPLGIPILYNVHAGHNKNPITLPIGANIKISGNRIFVTQRVVE